MRGLFVVLAVVLIIGGLLGEAGAASCGSLAQCRLQNALNARSTNTPIWPGPDELNANLFDIVLTATKNLGNEEYFFLLERPWISGIYTAWEVDTWYDVVAVDPSGTWIFYNPGQPGMDVVLTEGGEGEPFPTGLSSVQVQFQYNSPIQLKVQYVSADSWNFGTFYDDVVRTPEPSTLALLGLALGALGIVRLRRRYKSLI